MLYRRFGKTGLQMPVISFGCMRSMHSWQERPLPEIPAESTTKLRAIIDRALSLGINHFETAHDYGTSEIQLGEALQPFPRKDYLLQTKIRPEADVGKFLRNFQISLQRLQVEYVDLLALHGINDHRSLWYSCREGGCLAAARRLQAEGKIGHIGFSGHGPCDVIMDTINYRGDGGFDYLNVHWYYIFNANLAAVRLAAERDMGVYIISPSDKGGRLFRPPSTMQELCRPLSPMLFNDLFCLSQAGVTSISVGAAEPDQFDEHLLVLPLLAQATGDILDPIDRRLRAAMSAATGYDRPDALWHDLPEWDDTPGNINLRVILWLYNVVRGWGLLEYARERYRLLSCGTAWMAGNNAASIRELDFTDTFLEFPAVSAETIGLLSDAHTLLKRP